MVRMHIAAVVALVLIQVLCMCMSWHVAAIVLCAIIVLWIVILLPLYI